ncbi:MAG: hypothetical protein U0105_01495 [Candidatus Obscuribacterales bacterium]
MTDKVSKSKTAQNEPVPTRAERDAASSSSGGRKAVEVEVEVEAEVARKNEGAASDAIELAPPVGLDLETRGDQE